MKKENELIKELENLKYDLQYLNEMKKIIESEDLNLTKIYSNLELLKSLGIKTHNLEVELKLIIEEAIKKEKSLINALANRQKIQQRIDALEQPYKNILYFKYVCGNTFDEIALMMHYSTKRIYQLHQKATSLYYQKYK